MPFIRQTLSALNRDPVVIAWRQAVLEDFLRNPSLSERVIELLPILADLRIGRALMGKQRRNLLMETADRLAELDLYIKVVQTLHAALQTADIRSEALRQLRDQLLATINDDNFQALRTELPELQRPLQRFASLTVGINLDAQLRPVSAVLLGISEHPFGEARSFLGKLLGVSVQNDEETGIAPLHYTPSDPDQRPLSPLFRDLEHLISQSAQPVARALKRYVRISSGPVAGLEYELAFFVAAADLIRRLEARGVQFCKPEIVPAEERVSTVEDLVNLHLALRDLDRPLVSNDLTFDDQGRIAILTGPNSGGKTTYVQAAGLSHVLFQAGLFIPARRARISPVDSIFTHFPALESAQGRLSEEAARLRHICLNATRYSLVLLNESLSSTTASEALYLAQDLLCGLRAIGVRAIYATHLVELAERLNEIESAVEGDSAVYSLVAGIQLIEDGATGDVRGAPTFQISRGLPQGRSYAREIARRHGISLEQILAARRAQDTEAK
jgi:DNA mismatch repair ATPase MutS